MSSDSRPSVVIGVLLLSPKGEVLLFRTHKWKGKWAVPSGHVEEGETLAQAVIREMKEETGLDVVIRRPLGFQEMPFPGDYWQRKHFICFDFLCDSPSDGVRCNDEAEECRWVMPADALLMDIEPHTRKLVEEHRARLDSHIV